MAQNDLLNEMNNNMNDHVVRVMSRGGRMTMVPLYLEGHLKIIEKCVEYADGRICIIGGTGSNDTKHAIDFSVEAERLGCDGVLCVTPYYNKCTQKGLDAHYNAIANSIKIPVILYNVP